MANHKSAKKRIRQNKKRYLRNKSFLSSLRTEIKKFSTLVSDGKGEEASKFLASIHKIIDKSATKGLIHKKTAGRKKSKLTISLNNLLAKSA